MKKTIARLKEEIREFALSHRRFWPHAGIAAFLLIVVLVMTAGETVNVYHREVSSDFEDARIFGSNAKSIYEGKDALYGRSLHQLQEGQAQLKDIAEKLQKRLDDLEPKTEVKASSTPDEAPAVEVKNQEVAIRVHQANLNEDVQAAHPSLKKSEESYLPRAIGHWRNIISFPVKEVAKQENSVTLPSGSYVKAKLLTGVAAPEGKTYPVLLQLDFAFVMPNKTKLDLAGCFMIAKSQGDLSTERVQMQATKLSCVSKQGKMFEREINGFVADDKDNSFAVSGTVNSKQDRVATMAFLSSIVEGVGKAIQQAQTTQQTNALGGNQSVVTGDQASYMAAGGASQAAGMVTQWYLKQAQSLLPTISVGSGQDVWIVMHDSVKLPNSYFARNGAENDSSTYLYFSRLTE